MIITEKKKPEEVLERLSSYNSVYIVGCGICSTLCKTGGEPEVAEIKELLEKNGKTVSGTIVVEGPCNKAQARKDAKPEGDCILSLACGAGCAALSQLFDNPVVPGVNTLFLGTIDRDSFDENCMLCGECIIDDTGGICPVTRCAKGLLNGPCGGAKDGKCEVNPDRDCGWVLIFERLKERGKLDKIRVYREPKNYQLELKPQKVARKRASQKKVTEK